MRRLKSENPQALLDALDVITQSEIAHAKRALATGAAGVLLSVANANAQECSKEDYVKFSQPFDRRILEALPGAKLNILHLHVEPGYLEFFDEFPAPIINYFGSSDAADAFRAAFRIPNLLQNLFGEGVLSASFIPIYAGLLARGK